MINTTNDPSTPPTQRSIGELVQSIRDELLGVAGLGDHEVGAFHGVCGGVGGGGAALHERGGFCCGAVPDREVVVTDKLEC